MRWEMKSSALDTTLEGEWRGRSRGRGRGSNGGIGMLSVSMSMVAEGVGSGGTQGRADDGDWGEGGTERLGAGRGECRDGVLEGEGVD